MKFRNTFISIKKLPKKLQYSVNSIVTSVQKIYSLARLQTVHKSVGAIGTKKCLLKLFILLFLDRDAIYVRAMWALEYRRCIYSPNGL